ncbi:MAG: transcriptional repressor [Dehalococcoidia bacterium]|nr:transcriptional repressor [Dehalococcoidia bacterium]
MPATEIIERTLARGGYRLTAPRRALLEAMQDLDDHFTAEDVVTAAPEVGRATVFRTLRLMQDIGVVCQVVLDDGSVAYRLTSGGHHHHMVCSQCGAVADFTSHDIEDVLQQLADRTGYEIDAHRLEMYGRCPRCRALPDE